MDHQDIFDTPVEEMTATRNTQYLNAWIQMFYALQLQGRREAGKMVTLYQPATEEDDSMASFETLDLEEYLLDETDGMDREFDIVDGGAVLTPPGQISAHPLPTSRAEELRRQWKQWGIRTDQTGENADMALDGCKEAGKEVDVEATITRKFGEVELRKRKPPDGTS